MASTSAKNALIKAVTKVMTESWNTPNSPSYKIGGYQEKPLKNSKWAGLGRSGSSTAAAKATVKKITKYPNADARKGVYQAIIDGKGKKTSSVNYGPIMSSSGTYGNVGLGGSTSKTQFTSNPYAYLEYLQDKNTAINIQMNRENNNFAAAQSKLQRDWETEMSNTAHQREVADLKAAGLNPVLSANAGAAVPAGSAAGASNFVGADSAAISALAGVLESTLNANAVMTAAGINASANMYGADRSLESTKYASDVGLRGTKYASDKYYKGALTSSGINAAGNIIAGLMRLF